MLLEGIGKVSFVNGILRIQGLGVDASGNAVETGNIEIPANKVGEVIDALAASATGINEKLAQEVPASSNGKSDAKEKSKKTGDKKKK